MNIPLDTLAVIAFVACLLVVFIITSLVAVIFILAEKIRRE